MPVNQGSVKDATEQIYGSRNKLDSEIEELVIRYSKEYSNPGTKIKNDILTVYLRNATSSAKSLSQEEKDDVSRIIIMTRFYATLLKIPIWKMIHLLFAYGLKDFYKENEALLMACIEREKNAVAAADAIMRSEKEEADDRNAKFEEIIKSVINQSELRSDNMRRNKPKPPSQSNPSTKYRSCLVCGHEWILRLDYEPKMCPNMKCRSSYWNSKKKVA